MVYSSRSQLISRLSIEQQLFLSACSLEGTDGRCEAKELIEKPFSWEQLIALSERHRMLPLLYKNIKDDFEGLAIPSILKEKYLAQTQQTLRLATEAVRISSILNSEGVSNIMLKGPLMGQQLYGDLAIRPSRDIDILVTPDDVDAFHQVFLREGYKLIYPDFDLSPKQWAYYQRHKNQVAYRHLQSGTMVELHWRIFSQESLFPVALDRIFAERDELVVAGKSISLLSKAHCFEFLCLHGAIHQWFRLRWLRDISQLVNSEGFNIDAVMDNAAANGNERPVAQALIMSNLFFGSKVFSFRIKDEKAVNSLVCQAVDAAINEESYSQSKRITRLRGPFYKMKLKRSFRHKLGSWKILQPNFSDWKSVKLPDYLFFLYFFLRPFIWFHSAYMAKTRPRS